MPEGVRVIAVTVALVAVRVVLGVAAGVAQTTSAHRAIAVANPPLTAAQVDAVYHGVVGAVALAVIGYLGIAVALVVYLCRRRAWARNATRLLAGLSALAALGSLREAAPAVGHPMAAAVLGVDAAILVLLTVPAAGRWFAVAPERTP